MTEQEANDLRMAAWRINRLCGHVLWMAAGNDEDAQDAVRLARESAARLREMAGPAPPYLPELQCNGKGG